MMVILWFCYAVFNSRLFNGLNNCAIGTIIVAITLGKCAHRTPAGVRKLHICIGLMKSMKPPFTQLRLSSVERMGVDNT
jgi:hypothetical protein